MAGLSDLAATPVAFCRLRALNFTPRTTAHQDLCGDLLDGVHRLKRFMVLGKKCIGQIASRAIMKLNYIITGLQYNYNSRFPHRN